MEVAERSVVHPASDEGRSLRVCGETFTVRVRGGDFTLIESAAPPGGGLPPHSHHAQDEAVYVLEGEYALATGDRKMRLRPGSSAFVPRGMVHALEVVGNGPGRFLAILAPPGPMERFIEEIGVPVESEAAPAPDMDEVVASARQHGTYLLTRPV